MVKNNFSIAGSLHIPLALATMLGMFFMLGIFGIQKNWTYYVKEQFRLDHCVGKVALEFRDHMNQIEKSNHRIIGLRSALAIALATAQPELVSSLRAAQTLEKIIQDKEILQWKLRQTSWILSRGCNKSHDRALPLPSMKWIRIPEDPLGIQALHWEGGMQQSKPPNRHTFQAWSKNQSSNASVIKKEDHAQRTAHWGIKFSESSSPY